MSINLGNASHYDVHDASQVFSIWTEELRGVGFNWFFVMPNVYGKRPYGSIFLALQSSCRTGLPEAGMAESCNTVLPYCTQMDVLTAKILLLVLGYPLMASNVLGTICMETSPVQRRGLCKRGEPALLGLSLSRRLWRLMAMLRRLSHTMLTKLRQQLMQLHHS
jgi:hypothetical protein